MNNKIMDFIQSLQEKKIKKLKNRIKEKDQIIEKLQELCQDILNSISDHVDRNEKIIRECKQAFKEIKTDLLCLAEKKDNNNKEEKEGSVEEQGVEGTGEGGLRKETESVEES